MTASRPIWTAYDGGFKGAAFREDVTVDIGALYRGTRERITELVRGQPTAVTRAVGATPEWTVKDVVAHLTGVCADIVAGNIAGVTTEPWTRAQVEARREATLDEILDEWATVAPAVEEMAHLFGEAGEQWIADVVTHEHDLRGALGRPGARRGPAFDVALDFVGRHLAADAAANGLSGLRLEAGERAWATDDGPPRATLRAEPFEFLRAATGRRSLDQIRGLDWSGDPEPYLGAFEWGPFRPAVADLFEDAA